MILLPILFLILACLYEAHLDASKIKKGESISYTKSIIIRGLFFALQAWSMFLSSEITWIRAYAAIWAVIYQAMVYWIIFDFALNFFRGKPLDYLGKTSKLDMLFGKWITNLYSFTGIKILILISLPMIMKWIYQILSI